MRPKPISKSSDVRPPDDMLSPRSRSHPFRFPKRQTFEGTSDFGQKTEIQSKTEKNKESI